MNFRYKGSFEKSGYSSDRSFTYPSKSNSGISVTKNIAGVTETNELLVMKFGKKVIPWIAARALANVAINLLAAAQPRVPFDTGLLRVSGTATLKIGRSIQVVGVGKDDGTVISHIGSITKARLAGARTLRAEVSYKRIGDKGEDVALWTHEQIYPFEMRPKKPAARQPGTGPKYLEIPWLENYSSYIEYLKSDLSGIGFETTIAKITKVTQKRAGRFIIKDFIDIIPEQISFGGYFPPALGYSKGGRRSWKRK